MKVSPNRIKNRAFGLDSIIHVAVFRSKETVGLPKSIERFFLRKTTEVLYGLRGSRGSPRRKVMGSAVTTIGFGFSKSSRCDFASFASSNKFSLVSHCCKVSGTD